jgi:enoyl-CoA hydratase
MQKYRFIAAEVGTQAVGVITLRRPEKLNALTAAMRREISACLAAWANDPGVGVVAFTGAGRAFSAGFDIEEFRDASLHGEILASSTAFHRDVWRFPKPTIAAVNGLAAGGGFDLATLCDLRLCTEEAWFAHPEIERGAPPLFTPLRWIVGDALARDICLTRRRLIADEALRVGLVRQVVPASGLLAAAAELARLVLQAPADALRFIKERFVASARHDFETCMAEEHDRAYRELLLASPRWR